MLLTSVGTVMTVAPGISASARSSASWLRSARQIFIPSEANRFAAARPMPPAPPVMTAARPSVKAGCILSLLSPARLRSCAGEAVEHVFQREFAADTALLVATVGLFCEIDHSLKSDRGFEFLSLRQGVCLTGAFYGHRRDAGVIEPALQAAEIRRSAARPTTDLSAYDLYLRALAAFHPITKERVLEALGLLEQAIASDRHYGPALSWAAMCHMWLVVAGWAEAPET